MKRLIFLLALLLLPTTYAYINCTPSPCPSGFTDNGTICVGSQCERQCIRIVCEGSWSEVHSSDCIIDAVDSDVENCESTHYIPTDSSSCYRFDYLGPTQHSDYIKMAVKDSTSPDCDSEFAGGFWETTLDNGNANPWFETISAFHGYWGAEGANKNVEDFLVVAKTDAEEDSFDEPTYLTQAGINDTLYCAPNSGNCSILGSSRCDTDCYNEPTKIHGVQGYFEDTGPDDETIKDYVPCSDADDADLNYQKNITFKVYQSSVGLNLTTNVCERTNEAPSAYNVTVEPMLPTAGDSLWCAFDYIDPENFEEQNSSYQWFKNGINQNISEQMLGKLNLTVGDSWYCRVAPSDGLLSNTNYTQSSNNVTILTTVNNPTLYANQQAAWNYLGYYSALESIYNFSEQVESSLDTCTEDAEGYCTITLNFSSDTAGSINISAIEIVYEIPVTITNHSIVPSNASAGDNLTCIFEYVGDANGNSTYKWWKDGTLAASGTIGSQQNLTINTTGLMGGDIVSCEITPSSGTQESPAQNASITLQGPGLKIQSFQELSSPEAQKVVRILLNNTGTTNLTNINWTLNWGEGTVRSAQQLINLSVNETAHVVVANAYSSSLIGTYTANISASTGNLLPSALINITYAGDINISLIATQHTQSALIFKINNTANTIREVTNWTIQWGDGITTNSTQGVNLSTDESFLLAAAHTYTNIGTYTATLTVNGVYTFAATIFTGRLAIEDFTVFNSSTMGFARFRINNTGFQTIYDIQNWSVRWGDGYITNGTQPFNLTVNKSMVILAAHNYTPGDYAVHALVNYSAINEERNQSLTI